MKNILNTDRDIQDAADNAMNFIEDECGQCVFFDTEECPKFGKVFAVTKYNGCKKFYT